MSGFAFTKAERLSGERNIARLFGEGTGGVAWPLRYVLVVDRTEGTAAGVSVLVSVPKRNHKRAVSRNVLKRRIREAYRLNKTALVAAATERNLQVMLGLVYIAKEQTDFQTIEHAVKKILATVTGRL